MRKVKIINTTELNVFGAHAKQIEEAVNHAFEEIAEENGNIVKTTYLRSNGGELQTVIIEYDIDTVGDVHNKRI